MIHPVDFRDLIVKPTLEHLGMHSLAAEQLVLATAIHESHLKYLRQIGGGPALGLFQMEPATYFDIWANYLRHRKPLADKVKSLRAPAPAAMADQLATNLLYACAMCRIHYWRKPDPLPAAGDAEGIGKYWKKYYNTTLGAGTVPQFVLGYNEHVKPLYA